MLSHETLSTSALVEMVYISVLFVLRCSFQNVSSNISKQQQAHTGYMPLPTPLLLSLRVKVKFSDQPWVHRITRADDGW